MTLLATHSPSVRRKFLRWRYRTWLYVPVSFGLGNDWDNPDIDGVCIHDTTIINSNFVGPMYTIWMAVDE